LPAEHKIFETPSRASSTKTRIETICRAWYQGLDEHQEQVPRKQGLKLDGQSLPDIGIEHQEQVPRKQGLKPLIFYLSGAATMHQEQVPRKQGLKLIS